MNSSVICVLCFVAVITLNTIYFASANYEPLYVIRSADATEYYFAHDLEYIDADENYILKVSEKNLLIEACPQTTDSNLLEIESMRNLKMIVKSSCNKPVKSRIFIQVIRLNDTLGSVGFSVHTPKENTVEGDPNNYEKLNLITFKFDQSLNRIKFLTYAIIEGRFLNPEISTDNKNTAQDYHKDEIIYHYDVDFLYSQTSHSLVKVYLAPEEDFFFNNWKLTTKHITLTAPMWSELLPQWQELEKYIRKVTRVINYVIVTTGIHDVIKQSTGHSSQTLFLHDNKYPAPKYYWKAIYLNFAYDHKQHRYGILFVMHNSVPNSTAEWNEPKICPELNLAEIGWQFLPDDKFKSQMYACSYDSANMAALQEISNSEFKIFNLNDDVLVPEFDYDGHVKHATMMKILEEMRKLKLIKGSK